VKKRLAVYTVLTGNKEPLGNPLVGLESHDTDLIIDYICFTDNHELTSDVWKFHYIDETCLPPEKLSRRPKAMPHEYLSISYGYSLYIDNIVIFKRLPLSSDLDTDQPYLFRVYRHLTRKNPSEEADAIVMLGYDDPVTICSQIDFYSRFRSIESIGPLHTCTIIFRSHNHPTLVNFGIIWWEHILSFSKRDQMSFDFAALHAGCRIEALPGMKEDNDLFYPPHDSMQGRVKANFDAIRYAWRNRNEYDAKISPQAHYLASGGRNDAEYSRHIPLFNYICHKRKSSLGSHVAPRRMVADFIQMICEPLRNAKGNFLSIRIRESGCNEAFTDTEFLTAESAFGTYLNQYEGITADFSAHGFLPGSEIGLATDLRFTIILVLGLPKICVPAISEKLNKLLKSECGALIVIGTEPIPISEIAVQEQKLSKLLEVSCYSVVAPSEHDNKNTSIMNGSFGFIW